MENIEQESRPLIKNEEINEEWLNRRRETFVMYSFEMFVQGLQFTMLHSTMWFYITKGMHVTNPYWTYAVICAGRFMCPIFTNLIVSRWFDVHRRLRFSSLVINTLSATGYLLYMVSFSPYYAIVGIILQGSAFVIQTLMNSEILRVYEEVEIQKKFLISIFAVGLGECIGPIFVKLMDSVDFWIGSLHVMYGNVAALFLFVITVIKLLLSIFFVHDLSLEYDLKEHIAQAKEIVLDNDGNCSSILRILRQTMTKDIIFLLILQSYAAIIFGILPQMIPLIIQAFHYKNLIVDIWFMGASLCMVLGSLIVKFSHKSKTNVYYYGIISLILILVINVGLMSIKVQNNNVLNLIFLLFFGVSYGIGFTCGKTFIIVTIGMMCESSKQTFVEGSRMIMELSGALLGSLIFPFIYQSLLLGSAVLLGLNIIFFIITIMNRSTLSDPQIMPNYG